MQITKPQTAQAADTDAGDDQLGALRISELTTSRGDAHLKSLPPSQSATLRVVLTGMYGLAARHDVVHHNPVRET